MIASGDNLYPSSFVFYLKLKKKKKGNKWKLIKKERKKNTWKMKIILFEKSKTRTFPVRLLLNYYSQLILIYLLLIFIYQY